MIQWIEKTNKNVAWFTIDNNDNNIKTFLFNLINTILSIQKNFGKELLSILSLNQKLEMDYFLSLLINEILSYHIDFFVVIDNYHLINNKQVIQTISFLLEHISENLHLIIISRNETSDLTLIRLRSNNNLLELKINTLKFSKDEIKEFFQNSNVTLADDLLKLIEKRTEGWPLL